MSQVSSGWLAVDETWTRASNTTFTIAGDKTDKYQKGDKIKLTQSGNTKYFYIIGIAYSSPDTTITITGGSDYSLASATISSPYFSKVENPQGFPGWFNYVPTFSASGSMTWTSVSANIAKFHIGGKMVVVQLSCTGTTGGSVDSDLRATFPVDIKGPASNVYVSCGGLYRDGGAFGSLASLGATIDYQVFRKGDASNWGLGTNRGIHITITCELL